MEVITLTDNDFAENTYVVVERPSAFIIDSGASFESIMSLTENNKLKIRNILLTHAHYDHIMSLGHFELGIVWAHEDERALLENPEINLSSLIGMPLSFKGVNYVKGSRQVVCGFEFIHVPGHTSGSCLIKKDNVLFTGDTLFRDTVGRTDTPTGDSLALKKSLAVFDSFDKNIICYPGHGGPFKLADAYKVNYFLKGKNQ